MIIESRAPTRVDLAGGTLDIWPLYLFHDDAQTINFAISYYARCRLIPRRDRAIELISRDLGRRESFPSLEALAKASTFRLPLLARLVIAFTPRNGLALDTTGEAPAGAGLGGSSALNIAVCGALARFTGIRTPSPKLIEMARNVEAQVLRIPAGEQDYYPAVHGGIQAIHLRPGGVQPEKLAVDSAALAARVVLCYTGQSRNSGFNNWEVMKAHIDGKQSVLRQFDRIASIAAAMRQALEKHDWPEVARLLNQDWNARKRNYPGITTSAIERLTTTARRHGGLAAKACGAGGGGCVMFLVQPDARQGVATALREQGAQLLPFQIAKRGLQVQAMEGRAR